MLLFRSSIPHNNKIPKIPINPWGLKYDLWGVDDYMVCRWITFSFEFNRCGWVVALWLVMKSKWNKLYMLTLIDDVLWIRLLWESFLFRGKNLLMGLCLQRKYTSIGANEYNLSLMRCDVFALVAKWWGPRGESPLLRVIKISNKYLVYKKRAVLHANFMWCRS